MAKDTLKKILELLNEKKIDFIHLKHEHVHTSKDAAKIRGNDITQAAKAIILKIKDKKGNYEFIQCVLSGHKKIDFKILRKELNLRSTALATPEEVLEITKCTIGSVPPFGPLFKLKTLVDKAVENQEFIYFSAGTHNDSIRMKSNDFISLFDFSVLNFSV